MTKKVEVPLSDLQKLYDVLYRAKDYHWHKDVMNSNTHMSTTRTSPLTSALVSAVERLLDILDEAENE